MNASRLGVSLAGLALATGVIACRERVGRARPAELRAQLAALERERDELRQKLDALVVKDPRLQGMPPHPVRVGVPTALARELVTKVLTGFVDQVGLDLKNLRVRKSGSLKKVVTLGQYDLEVLVNRVQGRLTTGRPDLRFGGNQIGLALPVRVASGQGRATVHFVWDGKSVGGAVCGDLDITEEVSGRVVPESYPVSGALLLSATATEILATPKLPKTRVNLKIEAADESWAAVQKILDEKKGLCGFVLEKVDVMAIVRDLVGRGFGVTLPTDKLKAVAVPVGIEPRMEVRGQTVDLAITLGGLAITEEMIWLGADVAVRRPESAPPPEHVRTPEP